MASSPRSPGVGIGVLIPHPGSTTQFLLGQRTGSIGANTWALPGGHLEFGENFSDCALREALEETGLRLDPSTCEVVGVVNTVWKDVKAPDGVAHYVTVFVKGRIVGDAEPKIMEPDKCQEWTWAEWSEVREWAREQAGEEQDDLQAEKKKEKLFPVIVDFFMEYPEISLV